MPRSRAPDRVALTGADCFLRAFDFEVRRKSGASHLSQLVLRLGPGLDPGALAKLIAEIAQAQPILRAPIRRPWGVLPPEFRLDLGAKARLPRVEVHDAPPAVEEPELPPLFA